MSITYEPAARRSRWRGPSAVLATTALILASAGIAMADDVAVDNDVIAPGVQHEVNLTVGPGDPVSASAQMVVDYQGSNHLAEGSAIAVEVGPATDYDGVTGVTVGAATGNVPGTWTSASPNFTLSSAISFNAPSVPGVYNLVIHFVPKTYSCVGGGDKCLSPGTGDPMNINLTVEEPAVTNTAPVVGFTSAPATANEGQTKTYTFSITDPDSADTHSFVASSPNCGTGNTVSNASIDQTANTGTFDCKFIDGLNPAVVTNVTVQVTDGTASSNVATTPVTVSNVAPTVTGPPQFLSANVQCRVAVTLSDITFSDPGTDDDDWTVSIDWGDGNTDNVTRNTQGDVPDQTHTYTTGGTFSAKVTVTDKDHESSSQVTSSNSVTVQQYAVDFLPPFDDSSPSGLIVNKMKNGRVVPVKATIYDFCAGAAVTDPATAVTIKTSKTSGTGTGDPVEEYADAGQSASNTNAFRWSSDGFWIYNLDSKTLGLVVNNNYRVDIYVGAAKATTNTWAVLQPVK